MLAALDALIQNGTGGRRALALRQLCELFLKVGASGEESTTTLFDEVMANIAADLDDDAVVFLASEMHQMAAILPAFASTISSKGHEIALRPSLSGLSDIALKPETVEHSSPEPDIIIQPGLQDSDIEALPVAVAAAPEVMVQEAMVQKVMVPAIAVPEAPNGVPMAPPLSVDRRTAPRDPLADANNPITLARKASVTELLQIAALPNLPETLTNVLVARGERDVLEKVLKNKTATFSRSSLTTLTELAPSDRMIKDCLIARRDLPEAIIERLLPFLAPEAKAQLLYSDSPFGEEEARAALLQASADLVVAYRNGQMMMGVDTCLATLDEGTMTLSEIVIALARDIRVAELSTFVAARLGIRQVTAFNALSTRLDHTAAVLMRALDCDMEALEAVMTMRGRCGCREVKETKSACFTARRYSHEDAQTLVGRFDRIAQSKAEACDSLVGSIQEALMPEGLMHEPARFAA